MEGELRSDWVGCFDGHCAGPLGLRVPKGRPALGALGSNQPSVSGEREAGRAVVFPQQFPAAEHTSF